MFHLRDSVKTLTYVCQLLFPKYPCYYFSCFMILQYSIVQLKQKRFKVISRPLAYIKALLEELPIDHSIDVNNCVFLKGHRFLVAFAKLYDRENSKCTSRFVQIVTTNKNCIERNEVLVTGTLEYNIKTVNNLTESLNINFARPSDALLASEVEMSQVNIFCDIPSDIIDAVLKQYFATPKFLNKNDVISINVKEYAAKHYFTNKQVNGVKTIYFKCNRVFNSKLSHFDGSFVCVADHTSLKLSSNVQSFVPKETAFITRNNQCIIDLCPFGLTQHFEDLKASIKPFLTKTGLNLKPLFLMQGNKGCGKNMVVSAAAAALGLHMYKASSVDIAATSYSQVESKLRSLLFKIKLVSPCIFVVNNFENFGKNHEGLYDQRIIYNFQNEIQNLFQNNNYPIIVICISNKKQINSDLKRMFLKIFDIQVPSVLEREQMLSWLLLCKSLKLRGDLNAIASKCHGFYYEDLEALVFHAVKINYGYGFDDGFINEESFLKALDSMQANYSKSMGAPKVPKVEWSDIGGLDDVKTEIIKTVQLPIKHPGYFAATGLKRSGILLYGPPGTGKTLIAKAVATECNLCFLSVKGPELLNMYVGQSEENIRNVFQRAREAAPCIIFFDELDSLAPNRGVAGDSGGVMDRVVSQLLAEMDGLNETATVIIIGATNRPDLLDQALLRPGRFDKLLYVGPCNTKESKVSVLRALTKKFTFSSDVDLEEIVDLCPVNITGADYYGLCSSAWMSAVRKLVGQSENCTSEFDVDEVVVNKDDFLCSIRNLKPSIKETDLQYFEKLQNQFSSAN